MNTFFDDVNYQYYRQKKADEHVQFISKKGLDRILCNR